MSENGRRPPPPPATSASLTIPILRALTRPEAPEAPEVPARYAELSYDARPAYPLRQIAARAALWALVAGGCVAGVAGLLRSPDAAAPASAAPAPEGVPAPVAGTAERAVTLWLAAGEGSADELAALFVEPPGPSTSSADAPRFVVRSATAVTGRRLDDGYWTVGVAAEVIEEVPAGAASDAEDEAAADADGPTEPVATWYVEVGIVGDPDGRLAALTTPAVMPGPADGALGWQPDRPGMQTPEQDDPLVATVTGFFEALLVGDGDAERYLAPGVSLSPPRPAPFAGVEVEGIGVEDLDDGRLHVWVDLAATSVGGVERPVAYELIVTSRVDRWEIAELSSSLTASASHGSDA